MNILTLVSIVTKGKKFTYFTLLLNYYYITTVAQTEMKIWCVKGMYMLKVV